MKILTKVTKMFDFKLFYYTQNKKIFDFCCEFIGKRIQVSHFVVKDNVPQSACTKLVTPENSTVSCRPA